MIARKHKDLFLVSIVQQLKKLFPLKTVGVFELKNIKKGHIENLFKQFFIKQQTNLNYTGTKLK